MAHHHRQRQASPFPSAPGGGRAGAGAPPRAGPPAHTGTGAPAADSAAKNELRVWAWRAPVCVLWGWDGVLTLPLLLRSRTT